MIPSVRNFILGLCTLLTLSCAGGSRGTGGIEIDGKLLTASSQPLAGATVTLLDNGTQAVTDANGDFVLLTSTAGEPLLKIESSSGTTQVSITGVPEDAKVVQVTIEVNTSNNSAFVKDVTVKNRRGSDRKEDRDENSGSSDNNDNRGGNSGSDDDSDDRSDSGDDNRGPGSNGGSAIDDNDSNDDSDDSNDRDNSGSGSVSDDGSSDDNDQPDDSDNESSSDDDNSGSGNRGRN